MLVLDISLWLLHEYTNRVSTTHLSMALIHSRELTLGRARMTFTSAHMM
jgi:hypothetical protein